MNWNDKDSGWHGARASIFKPNHKEKAGPSALPFSLHFPETLSPGSRGTTNPNSLLSFLENT